MAIKTKEELLESIKSRIGEDTSDEAIALIEDVSDTYADMETRITEAGDWKNRYEENDKAWREKYKERFFNAEELPKSGAESIDIDDTPDVEQKTLSFEELFKTE